METKKQVATAPKNGDVKKQKAEKSPETNLAKSPIRKKLNEFGDTDSF